MKSILDYTDEELLLKLPVNGAVRIGLEHKPEMVITHTKQDGDDEFFFDEYVTEASEEYQRLLSFIGSKNGTPIIYANCPKCRKETYYTIGPSEKSLLDTRLLSPVLCKYTEDQIDNDKIRIPDADEEARDKAKSLARTARFMDRYFQCPNCKEFYRVSFALEYHEKLKADTDGEYDCEMVLVKIGQYPSLQKLTVMDNKEYDKVLDSLDRKSDYRNAIRNHIDEDNIAAYVHLRRIVEKIVTDAYTDNKDGLAVSDDDFERLPINKKIETLKEFLPDFLSENKEIYSVLSEGIHTLTEEQCKKYYGDLKDAVDIMLHQEAAVRKRRGLMKKAAKGIQEAADEVRQSGKGG